MPVTPRNETERLLLESLHADMDRKRTARDLYPRRVTNHVHRFLEAWEKQGVLDTGSAWYGGWTHVTTYVLKREHMDPDMRAQALARQAEYLIIQRTDLTEVLAERERVARDMEEPMRQRMAQGVTPEEMPDLVEALEDYAAALQNVLDARDWIAGNDDATKILRQQIADEGFDVNAIWSGHVTEPTPPTSAPDPNADPLGGDA